MAEDERILVGEVECPNCHYRIQYAGYGETESEIANRKIDEYIDYIKAECDPVVGRELIGIFEACKDHLAKNKGRE